MANRFLNNIRINDEYTLPAADGTADQVLTTDGAGQLVFVDQDTIASGSAEVVEVPVKNLQGSALTKGDPVYISGSVGASGILEVQLADAGNAAKMPAVGLLKQDLAANAEGFAVVTGKLRNLVTSPIDGVTPSPNDVIYVKSGGSTGAALTTTKPTGSTNLIQNMGKVGRVSTAADGTLVVSSILRSNDVPNLPLGRLFVGTNTNTSLTSDVVYIDDANDRVGINTTSPGTYLQVNGTGEIIRLNDTNATANPYLSFYQNGTRRSYVQHVDSGDNFTLGSEYGGIRFLTGTGGIETEKVRILSNGNVGIGTTNPQEELHIASAVPVIRIEDTDGGYAQIVGSNGSLSLRADQANTVASSIIDFTIDNSEKMRITNTGNVGIGTTSPSAKLHIEGDGSIIRLQNNNSDTNGTFIDFRDSTGIRTGYVGTTGTSDDMFLFTQGAKPIRFYTNASERMRIDSAGKVGIGTTSPTAKLTVNSGSSDEVIRLDHGSATGNPYISFYQNGTRRGFIQQHDSSDRMNIVSEYGPIALKTGTGGTETTKIEIATSGALQLNNYGSGTFTGTATQRLGVDSSGNVIEIAIGSGAVDGSGTANYVTKWTDADTIGNSIIYDDGTDIGISTTAPTHKLHVNGDARVGTNLAIGNTFGNKGTNQGINFESPSTALQTARVDADAFRFYFGGTGGGGEVFRILEGGNVGIGTTSPGSKLDVSGGDIRLSTNATYLRSKDSASGIPRVLGMNASNAFYIGPIDSYAGGGIIYGASSNVSYHGFYGGGSEKVRITSSGNVGIGTTSPGDKLHVVGNIYLGTSNQTIYTTSTANVNLQTGTGAIKVLTDNGATTIADFQNAGSLQLAQYGSGTFTGTAAKMLAVDSSGNVIEETISSATIGGSGTTNYIPVFTGSTTIASSIMSQSSGVIDVNGTIRYDEQVASNQNNGAKAFIAISSGAGAEKYKVYKNTNTTDGYARFKLDRAYDYGNNDQMVQEAIYQRRTTTKNVKFRYDGDIATTDDAYLEFYELTDGTVEGWVCVDDFSKCFVEIYYDSNIGETYPNPSAATPTGTLIHSTNPDSETPNWDTHQGPGTFNGDVNIDSSYALQFGGVDVVDVTTTYTRLRDMAGATRIYLGASDAQNYYDNNSHRFRNSGGGTTYGLWQNSGLGIGETSIDARLHITTATAGLVNQKFESAGSAAWRVGIPASQTYFAFDNANDNLSAPKVVINSSGDVGIGTTSPSGGAVGGKVLHLVNSGGTASVRVDRSDSTTTGTISLLDANSTHGLFGTGSKPMAFSTDSTERMRIDSSGNVGIGTTSPSQKLDVNGDVGINGYIYHNGDDSRIGFEGNDAIRVYTANSVRMQIDSSGNVGIGTTNPGSKLEVDGEITTKNLSYTYPTVNNQYRGEIVTFGTFDTKNGTILEGDVIVYTTAGLSSGWMRAQGNVTYSKGMLGIAMGTTPSAGILIKGFARNAAFASGGLGSPLYLSPTSAGDTTSTVPSSTNNIVRIVGYMLNPTNDEIFFDPDKSWVQVS